MAARSLLLIVLLLSLASCTVRREENDAAPAPAPREEKREAALVEQASLPSQDPWEGLFEPAARISPPTSLPPSKATSIPAFPTPEASAEASPPASLPSAEETYIINTPETGTP